MIDFITFMRHAWFKGHSIETNRYISKLAQDTSKGWFMKCSCGKTWAR